MTVHNIFTEMMMAWTSAFSATAIARHLINLFPPIGKGITLSLTNRLAQSERFRLLIPIPSIRSRSDFGEPKRD